MTLNRRQLLAALPAVSLLGARAHAGEVMQYRYRDNANTSRRDAYQVELLTLALELTVASDGPYRIVRVSEPVTPRRLLLEMNDGRRINIFVGAQRSANAGLAHHEQLAVPFSILDRLVGYRALIVRREDLARFAAIETLDQLKRLRAGQGRDWLDARILRHNGFRMDDSGQLDTLLPMLANKRFDFVPLGIVEVESVLARHEDIAAQLAVVPRLAIEYPLPVVYFVSKRHPALADRLLRGLQAASANGGFDKLVLKFFGRELKAMRTESGRHFMLSNPFLPAG